MNKLLEKIQSTLISKSVELIWLVITSVIAVLVPSNIKKNIYEKLIDLFVVIPSPVFGLVIIA